jgi:hypothetical protein
LKECAENNYIIKYVLLLKDVVQTLFPAEYFHDLFSLYEMSFCEYGWQKKIIKRS